LETAAWNNYMGPKFFSEDAAITKSFNIWESVNAVFRMDASTCSIT